MINRGLGKILLLTILVCFPGAAKAGSLKGSVTDSGGNALAGAAVEVVGSKLGASSNDDGTYSISGVPIGTYSVRASLIGYGSVVQTQIAVGAGSATVDFALSVEPIELSSTLISASAIGEDAGRAPNRVNVIDKAEIDRTTARNVQEVLQHVEGLYVTRGEGLLVTFPQIIVRGLSTGYLGRSTSALVMLNGHSINGSLGSWANIGDLDAVPLDIVRKTEVIKGPYTSTYGSGATGGVINVVTRKHFGAPAGGSVRTRMGPYGFRSIAPVAFGQQGRLSYAAWGEFLHGGERETRRRTDFLTGESTRPVTGSDGAVTNVPVWNDSTVGYMDEGRVEHSKYGFMLGYDITSGDRLDILGNRLEKFNNYNGRPISFEEITGNILHVTFSRKINDDLDLRVLGNFLSTDYDGLSDAAPPDTATADRTTKLEQWPNRELGMKVELSGNVVGTHRFAAGLEWRRNESSRTTWYGNREILEFDVQGTQDIYSVFVEDKIELGKLEVTPGVRLEQWKDNALYSEQEPDDAVGGRVHIGYASGRDDNNAINPKLGVAYWLADNFKLRGSAGSTFRAPRITETYSPNYQTLAFLLYRSNLDLQEETIVSYEVGADLTAMQERLSLSVTAFAVDAQDRIEFTFLGGFTEDDPFVIEHKNFDQKIQGLEAEAGFRLSDEVGIGANLSVLDAEYTSGDSTIDGRTPPGVPNHTLNAHVDYRPPVEGLTARLSVQRVGEIWDDSQNTDDANPKVSLTDSQDADLDPYTLVNLKARYVLPLGSEQVYVDVDVTNLLDEDYQIYANRVWDYKPLGQALHVGLGYTF